MQSLIDFAQNSLWLNLLLFTAGAVAVWLAGGRLEQYADVISERTGIGKAFGGLVLLALATSLPELATTITSSSRGFGSLAVNNLMGGVAMQTALLAVADWRLAKGRLTFVTPTFVLLLQGVALMVLLAFALAAMALGEGFSVGAVGGWTILLMLVYLGFLHQIYTYRGSARWQPAPLEEAFEGEEKQRRGHEMIEAVGVGDADASMETADWSLGNVMLRFGGGSVLVLAAGWLVARVAEALIEQLGLSAGFVGAVLIAISTSLPELSTTTAAVRRGHYTTAISNIFGTNLIEVALLLVADVAYREGPVMDTAGTHGMFAAALGIIVTGIYLWGLLTREHRTWKRIGTDSALVLIIYLVGVVLLYTIG